MNINTHAKNKHTVTNTQERHWPQMIESNIKPSTDKKVSKCNEDDTIGDLKKIVANRNLG